jgi:pyridoxamine 5'-phosphate oxidase
MNNRYSRDPLREFRQWYEKAGTEAAALATATSDGAPSVRMVLLRGVDERGFTFFTSYESRKGRELAENPRAALLFHWPDRQVRVEGVVERVGAEESDAYWSTRPRGAQIAATISRQSEPVESREALETRFAEVDAGTAGEVPRPPHWGGYRLVPSSFEFWQHRDDRMHDRIRYRRERTRWIVERLAP